MKIYNCVYLKNSVFVAEKYSIKKKIVNAFSLFCRLGDNVFGIGLLNHSKVVLHEELPKGQSGAQRANHQLPVYCVYSWV